MSSECYGHFFRVQHTTRPSLDLYKSYDYVKPPESTRKRDRSYITTEKRIRKSPKTRIDRDKAMEYLDTFEKEFNASTISTVRNRNSTRQYLWNRDIYSSKDTESIPEIEDDASRVWKTCVSTRRSAKLRQRIPSSVPIEESTEVSLPETSESSHTIRDESSRIRVHTKAYQPKKCQPALSSSSSSTVSSPSVSALEVSEVGFTVSCGMETVSRSAIPSVTSSHFESCLDSTTDTSFAESETINPKLMDSFASEIQILPAKLVMQSSSGMDSEAWKPNPNPKRTSTMTSKFMSREALSTTTFSGTSQLVTDVDELLSTMEQDDPIDSMYVAFSEMHRNHPEMTLKFHEMIEFADSLLEESLTFVVY